MVTAYFACVYLGKTVKLKILVQHIHRAAQRIYGIPEFRYYALADGIKKILYSRPGGIGPPHLESKDDTVLLLPLTL
jgi:hypothetical protein